ncbi:hypothetical protein B0T10DRAFT_610319 [Thelonectria olida]|uniref:DUF4238 domain-containing protein n=1 Tax=Thelonectria olida TaxID=1576542 RepID=A0A9P8VVU4_9HYPO|nr:hypothetical protein B0T10DRAFT_610319 [Thelonectria olida]
MAEISKPQFHHFVPQFLLKNFSHKYKPPNEKKKGGKRRKKRYEKGMYPGDPVVRHVDLQVDPYVIREKPLSRILGKQDMYRDTSKESPRQQHIEELLSKLESNASAIFSKIRDAHKDQRADIWLTRQERDVVRKFLFIQKYRGSNFHRRFYHETPETYDSNDRQPLLEYMKEKGYTRPIDVWFDNLKAIIELKMDPEKKWMFEIQARMFPDDAMWFVAHAQYQYMTFCTPQDAAAEFILTDNSYNIFEGPNTLVKDEKTGEMRGSAHCSLHEFAPVSPKLMIVLRSLMFPVPEEDSNEDQKRCRDEMRARVLSDFGPGYRINSALADLPVAKPRNNYSKIVHGRVLALDGEDGTGRNSHKFLFKFFPINTKHVNVINGLLFDNISVCTSIVFNSEAAFKFTLEWFITAPTEGFGKLCLNDVNDPRLGCLRKLEALSRSLGSDKELVCDMQDPPPGIDYEQYLHHYLEEEKLLKRHAKPEEDNGDGSWLKSNPIYHLDSDKSTLLYDMKQSVLMWKLRVKIDVWSQGLDERIRQRNRELLIDAYLRLPPRRVFMYTRRMRLEFLSRAFPGERLGTDVSSFLQQDDPENLIARASHIMKPDKISKLLYQTTLNDLEIRTKLAPDLDMESMTMLALHKQMMLHRKITFETPGHIRDCGISEIEKIAALVQQAVIRHGVWQIPFPFPLADGLFSEGDKIELVTRVMVHDRFIDALKDRLDPQLLEQLHHVFFQVAYPTLELVEFDLQLAPEIQRELDKELDQNANLRSNLEFGNMDWISHYLGFVTRWLRW